MVEVISVAGFFDEILSGISYDKESRVGELYPFFV